MLYTTSPQLMWPPQCSKTFFFWSISWGWKRGNSLKGQNQVSRQGVSELQSEDCQFLVWNGRLVRRNTVLKKKIFLSKSCIDLVDQVLLQFVDKCKVILPWLLHPCSGSLQAKFNFCPTRQTPKPCLWVMWLEGLFFGLWSSPVSEVSSIVTTWLKNPTASNRNRFKMACEASSWSRFWTALRKWEPVQLRAFSCLKSRE
jgi:hypothetical protein